MARTGLGGRDQGVVQPQPLLPLDEDSPHPTFHIYWMTKMTTTTTTSTTTSLEQGKKKNPSSSSTTTTSSSSTPPPPKQKKLEKLFHDLVLPSGRRLETIVTKIPWWTTQQVEEVYHHERKNTGSTTTMGRLVLKNNITLKEAAKFPKPPNSYSYEHAARLLTHLEAIARAHQSEHNVVLFLEDGAILTQNFVDNWLDYANLAPRDWTVLQWATTNAATTHQSFSLPEPWISWLPDLWGTHAYTMRRDGMEAIWNRLAREKLTSNGEKAIFFTVDERFNGILLADELLFSVPGQVAYTSTFPWILSEEMKTSMNMNSTLGQYLQSHRNLTPPEVKTALPIRNESLLVFMNIRFSTSQRMAKEVNRALLDLEAVCQMHRKTKCDWIIHGVFTKDFLFKRFQDEYKDTLPSNVIHFKTTVGDARFNKFGILADHLSLMPDYDIVLVKDNDQRLAGFPWSSFLDKRDNALVSGPLRQAPDESFLRTKIWEISQHYKLHDSRGWKMKNFAPWSTPLFINATVIEVHFLEMYFNVFDGKFAEWFFSQILTKNFTAQDSCWGPDLLWCPAAQDYAKSNGQRGRKGCALVPLVSVHEDTRQIFKDGEEFNIRGYAAVENLRTSNKRFERWYDHSWKYARGVIAWRQLDAISGQCRKLQRGVYAVGKSIDFQACIAAGMRRKKII
jgi:hypothetical protein